MRAYPKILTISIGGILTAVLLVIFAVNPILSDVSGLRDQIRQGKTELAMLSQQILAFKTAQSDLGRALRKEEISDAIASREALVAAVIELESAVALSGGTHELQIKEPGADKKLLPVLNPIPGVTEVPYTLNVVNSYLGMLTMLSYMEHLPHFTEVAKINLSADTQGTSGAESVRTGAVLGNIEAVFFIKAEPSP